MTQGARGARDGAMVRALTSHQCGPASNPSVNAICGLSLLLVLSFAPRGFFPGTPVFPSPQKPILPNSNLIWNEQTRLNKFIWTAMCFMGKQAIYNFCCCFYKEQNTWYGRRFELLRITLGSTSVLKKKKQDKHT